MRRASLVGFAGAMVAASAAGTAFAAPPWSEPRPLGPATGMVSGAEIDFGPGGTALLSGRTNADRLTTLTPDGRLIEHRPLSDRLAVPPQVFGRGRVALLRERLLSEPDTARQRVRLSLSVGSTARPAGRGAPHRVATFTSFGNAAPAMAIGPQGHIAIAWAAYRGKDFGSGRFRVRLAVRGPDGRFGRTRTVASGPVDIEGGTLPPIAVAIGGRRDVVVAYAGGGISVRSLRRGRRFGPPQRLGPSSGFVELAARGSRSGRAVVAWATQDGGEDVSEPYAVRAAIRAPRAARFGSTRVLDPGEANHARVPGRVRLAMSADGTAALAWSNARGSFVEVTHPVRVAIAERDGGFGPVAELSANGAAQDVALRDDGAAVVVWTDARGFPSATLRTGPGQPFGQPELIAQGGADRNVAVAYDPRTRRPTAIWPATSGSDRLQLATRSG